MLAGRHLPSRLAKQLPLAHARRHTASHGGRDDDAAAVGCGGSVNAGATAAAVERAAGAGAGVRGRDGLGVHKLAAQHVGGAGRHGGTGRAGFGGAGRAGFGNAAEAGRPRERPSPLRPRRRRNAVAAAGGARPDAGATDRADAVTWVCGVFFTIGTKISLDSWVIWTSDLIISPPV